MKEIINILETLRTLSGNSAIDYLKSHSDNLLLKEVLQMTYDPDKKYGIKEDKFNKVLAKMNALDGSKTRVLGELDISLWERYKNALNELASKKGVQESDIARLLEEYFLVISKNDYELLRGILFKDLRLGMDVKTFCKVWKDFYFRFPYMGCKVFSIDNLKKITYPAIAQTKLDGLFCNIIVDVQNQTVDYVSRQGKPLNIKGGLEDELLKLNTSEKFVLNGEVLCIDKNTNKPLPREISNGIIRRDNKTKEELDSIIIVCWDIIPYDNFVEGRWDKEYINRLMLLKQICQKCNKVQLVNTYEVENIDNAMELFNKLYSQGEEGIVVKNKNGIWKDGKPSWQVKVKNESECDLRAIGFEEGSGAYAGMCGTIICESEDKLLQVGVKPRTPEQALDVWQSQDKYLNKILTVKYNAKIKRQDSEIYSLFLPVFVEWRDLDKTNADKLEDIK